MPDKVESGKLFWKVNTPGLLREILENNETRALRIPINIFAHLLAAVAERAGELNDPKLNALMAKLALYEIADPNSSSYDHAKCKQIYNEAGL